MRGKILFFLIALSFQSYGQNKPYFLNQYLEYILETSSEEVDIQELTDELIFYSNNPFDINHASHSQLLKSPFFSTRQALEIIEHKKRFGPLISIYELQVISKINPSQLLLILPFVSILKSPVTLKENIRLGRHQILSLTETSIPNNNGQKRKTHPGSDSLSHYLGSNVYHNVRYKFDYQKRISWGLNLEKDAGEAMQIDIPKNKWVYDYHSMYFVLKGMGKIDNLQLGDYHANFGQGLTMSTGLSFGKSGLITSAKRSYVHFKPNRSLRENAFLRGIGISIKHQNLTFGSFLSMRKREGSVYLEYNPKDKSILKSTSSITEDGGYYRTASEYARKNTIRDFQTGGFLEYNTSILKVGFIHQFRKFNTYVLPQHNRFLSTSFIGNKYIKDGMYYDAVYRNVNVYGEVCYSPFNSSFGQLHGALISLHKSLDINVLFRNYHPQFISYQTNGFGEKSTTQNETGLYLGFNIYLNDIIKVVGYHDFFRHAKATTNLKAPSYGQDLWIEIQYKPNKTFLAYYRFRTESKKINGTEIPLTKIHTRKVARHRINTTFKLSNSLTLKNRIEWNEVRIVNKSSAGSMIYQDISYNPMNKSYSLSGRIALNQIDDYSNRIYTFEKAPLYDYPMFNHNFSGIRFYGILKFTTFTKTDFWLKYGYLQHHTLIHSIDKPYSIGSGLQETNGPTRHTFTIQIRQSFN